MRGSPRSMSVRPLQPVREPSHAQQGPDGQRWYVPRCLPSASGSAGPGACVPRPASNCARFPMGLAVFGVLTKETPPLHRAILSQFSTQSLPRAHQQIPLPPGRSQDGFCCRCPFLLWNFGPPSASDSRFPHCNGSLASSSNRSLPQQLTCGPTTSRPTTRRPSTLTNGLERRAADGPLTLPPPHIPQGTPLPPFS